ncbi:MAG: hypothetical protein ABII00_07245 [Elusimicrobiota bacterium]
MNRLSSPVAAAFLAACLASSAATASRYTLVQFPNGKDFLVDARSGKTTPLEIGVGTDSGGRAATIVPSPGGKYLAFAMRDKGIVLVDLKKGSTRTLVKDNAIGLTWTPDEKQLLYMVESALPKETEKEKAAASEKAAAAPPPEGAQGEENAEDAEAEPAIEESFLYELRSVDIKSGEATKIMTQTLEVPALPPGAPDGGFEPIDHSPVIGVPARDPESPNPSALSHPPDIPPEMLNSAFESPTTTIEKK